jgi:hypothetical protein
MYLYRLEIKLDYKQVVAEKTFAEPLPSNGSICSNINMYVIRAYAVYQQMLRYAMIMFQIHKKNHVRRDVETITQFLTDFSSLNIIRRRLIGRL